MEVLHSVCNWRSQWGKIEMEKGCWEVALCLGHCLMVYVEEGDPGRHPNAY